jgi:hypothetical protein
MKLLASGVRGITFSIRLGVAPVRFSYRAARRGVDYAKELCQAVRAGMSDRFIDRAAKAYGRQNVLQEIG